MKPSNQAEARHTRHSEEPDAVIPHAGICGGNAGQTAFLP